MQTKELQNGRLAMLAAAGFMAQELADGKGIFEHLAQVFSLMEISSFLSGEATAA
jgi:hypothetical protein